MIRRWKHSSLKIHALGWLMGFALLLGTSDDAIYIDDLEEGA